ncbi:sensor histidine kinase [Paenibacillus macquariensis]|uniref:sensor histidine kinase n=1 Tax=Paenibacillus macquariensis TaxID=948756 RepID=UPI002DB7DC4A|nr:sensor histidine kinase [Paenibacillus macquariensis]
MNRLKGWNTLRNQIFIGFMLVMVIVLISSGTFTYNQTSILLRNSAERLVKQTAVQATVKLEALYQQVDSLLMQVSTNPSLQSILTREHSGKQVNFSERQSLQDVVRGYEAYGTGIRSLELYTEDYRRLLPLDDALLQDRVTESWIYQADEQKGKLVWCGLDPRDSTSVIAIRSVRLINRSFIHGGYIMLRMDRNYFELSDSLRTSDEPQRELMILLDGAGNKITADFLADESLIAEIGRDDETVMIHGESYMKIQQQSDVTGWTLVMLTPAKYTTEGVSVLRTSIIVSIAVGGLLFLVSSFVLSTMITRPILNLIRAMRGARLGNLKLNPDTSSTMEIAELNYSYNQMVNSLNEMIQVVYQKEIIQSRTELKALQSQINPHFLFNTLEAFFWSLDEKGETELADNVVAMSGLFRYVINRSDEDEWVKIGDELDHAERYFKIMEMRLVDRLIWRIEADEACRSIPIPKLLIQPLVENAIMHGVEKRNEQGTVVLRVEAATTPDYTRIMVIDSGPGMDEAMVQQLYATLQDGKKIISNGKGIGLVNVDRRLHLYYALQSKGIMIQSHVGEGTTIGFEIPNEIWGEL